MTSQFDPEPADERRDQRDDQRRRDHCKLRERDVRRQGDRACRYAAVADARVGYAARYPVVDLLGAPAKCADELLCERRRLPSERGAHLRVREQAIRDLRGEPALCRGEGHPLDGRVLECPLEVLLCALVLERRRQRIVERETGQHVGDDPLDHLTVEDDLRELLGERARERPVEDGLDAGASPGGRRPSLLRRRRR